MAYRLLAVDLDGTLLRADKTVDPTDIAAIRELAGSGVTVTIVTGRLHSGSVEAARTCGIGGAIACVEGSHIVEAESARTHVRHGMTPQVTSVLRDAFGANDLASFIFEHDGIHHDAAGEPFAGYVSTWSPTMRLVEEALDERVWANDPLAAVAIGDEHQVAAAHAALEAHAANIFSVSFAVSWCPGKHAVLVRAAGPTKGTALRALCDRQGISTAEAVVVGDWVNDVPMFEVAGRAFVMGGAPDAVRSRATDVLERQTGAGGGIAEAIRRAWG
ncbi:MAG TPA: HAD family hydrolase [Kofleriaceae bacterium]|nr:HAD family hydrolase [Kofleriaceae bacterium]